MSKRSVLNIFVILLLIAGHGLRAQVNTEFLRKENMKDGWFNSCALGIGYNSGNSNFARFRGDFRTDLKLSNSAMFLIGNLEYVEGNDKLIVHKGFAHFRYMYTLSAIFIPEIFIQKEFNRFILLNDRNIAGAGWRLHVIDINPAGDSLAKLNLYIGIGGMWEKEIIQSGQFKGMDVARSTNYINFDWAINSLLSLQAVTYLQFDVSRLSDHRLLSDATLSFSITKSVKFLAALHYRFDNEPPAGIRNYDLEISNGIRVDFDAW